MYNTIETFDNIFDFLKLSPSSFFHYFTAQESVSTISKFGNRISKNKYLTFLFTLSTSTTVHTREAYNVMDLLGDIGGIFEVLVMVFGVFISPFSEFEFSLKAI